MKVKKTPIFGLICITLLIIMIIDAPLWAIHNTSPTAMRTDLTSEKTEHSRDTSRETERVSVPKAHTFSTLSMDDIPWLWISDGPDIDN
ncbi:MAG: hypothetical protein ACE5I5_15420, partial [Candidatus Heimdallarchaeota archaeon]